jgi:single-stranded-DNA-specific exonuclease
MSGLFERLLKKRGVKADFLSPKYEDCVDPFVLNGMDEAVKRIKQAVEKQEKILIYGDYDVDGVTASTIMHDALEMAGAKEIEIMLPDRFVDGYGMNEKVVKQAKERGCSLIITVDCGSRNNDIIDKINAAQIDVIVTDHHECGEKLPKAVAVINPKSQVDGELHDLAGAGVAFKVAQALVKEGLIQARREKWLLDLVAIGTICDSMVLLGENRRLCYYGMIVLEKTHRVGLQELMKVAGIKKIT